MKLYRDTVFDDQNLTPTMVVDSTLPEMLKRTHLVPMFRYLRDAGLLDEHGKLVGNSIDVRISERLGPSTREKELKTSQQCYLRKEAEIRELGSIRAVLEEHGETLLHVVMYIPLLRFDQQDPGDIRAFLKENFGELHDGLYKTEFRRLVCLLDYLEYGPPSVRSDTEAAT